MSGETSITLVGHMTDDPELRFTSAGVAVANFTVASTPRHFDKATGEWRDGAAMFLRCSVWRQMAEHAVESLSKGSRVVVVGRLKQRTYEAKDGEKRTSFEVDVDEIAASLRSGPVKVARATRSGEVAAGSASADDPWSSPPPAGEFADEPAVSRG